MFVLFAMVRSYIESVANTDTHHTVMGRRQHKTDKRYKRNSATTKPVYSYLKQHTAALKALFQSKKTHVSIMSATETEEPLSVKTFPQFMQLTDDMQIHILSFVATAPYECPSASGAAASGSTADLKVSEAPAAPTLTGGGLPAVSRKFRDYCRNSSLLWETILERAVQTQSVWKIAVETVDPNWQRRLLPAHAAQQQQDGDTGDDEDDVVSATSTTTRSDGNCALLKFYKQVCSEQILFTGPVFFMGMQGMIPSRYDLFLFEPRYRLMMDTLLAQHPVAARRGNHIDPPVYFLHAYAGLNTNTTNNSGNTSPPALLVQVEECNMLPDGSCSVTLVTKWFTHLEKVWVLRNSGHLYYADAVKVRPAVDEE
jgi:hypothetical protein